MRKRRQRPDGSLVRILVIEADPPLRRALIRTLLEEGFDPHGLSSLDETPKALSESDFDILLLDENSAATNVLEFVQKLRSDGFSGPILLIATLLESSRRLFPASEAGVTELVRKPVSLENLRRALDRTTDATEVALPRASANRSSPRSNLFLALILMAVLGAAMAATTLLLSL